MESCHIPQAADPSGRRDDAAAARSTWARAELLTIFATRLHDGCAPLGIDATVWNPPDSSESAGFTYLMRYEDRQPTKTSKRKKGDRNVTEWSDGSLSSNARLLDGTFRFQVEIPVTEAGHPGDWCTYVYGPTGPDGTNTETIESLRFIRQRGVTDGAE